MAAVAATTVVAAIWLEAIPLPNRNLQPPDVATYYVGPAVPGSPQLANQDAVPKAAGPEPVSPGLGSFPVVISWLRNTTRLGRSYTFLFTVTMPRGSAASLAPDVISRLSIRLSFLTILAHKVASQFGIV